MQIVSWNRPALDYLSAVVVHAAPAVYNCLTFYASSAISNGGNVLRVAVASSTGTAVLASQLFTIAAAFTWYTLQFTAPNVTVPSYAVYLGGAVGSAEAQVAGAIELAYLAVTSSPLQSVRDGSLVLPSGGLSCNNASVSSLTCTGAAALGSLTVSGAHTDLDDQT